MPGLPIAASDSVKVLPTQQQFNRRHSALLALNMLALTRASTPCWRSHRQQSKTWSCTHFNTAGADVITSCKARRMAMHSNPERRGSPVATENLSSIIQQSGSTSPTASVDLPEQEQWRWEESKDALVSYGVLAAVLAVGAVPNPLLRSDNASDLFYFISLAVCTQYIGAHRSLTTNSRQQLSLQAGFIAPVAASISLFACYLIITYLPDLNISTLINGYFWLLGSFAGVGALGPLLKQLGGPLGQKSFAFDVPDGWLLDDSGKPVKKAEVAPTDVLALLGAVGLSTAHLVTQNYSLNNLMACLIATDILQLIGLRSFKVAGLLLLGLLSYDVFWVFGSPEVVGDNVMMTVATSDIITGPSRLLFPRTPGGIGEAADYPYSLLGLGDIAIPGLLACLALRYDASRVVNMAGRADAVFKAMQEAFDEMPSGMTGNQMADKSAKVAEAAYDKYADKEQRSRDQKVSGGATLSMDADASAAAAAAEKLHVNEEVLSQRKYFTPVMCAYVLGLLMAFEANHITHLGQPALLYIVPCVLTSVLMTGLYREELDRLWNFNDVPSFGLPVEATKKHGGEENSNN